jgi:aryl-alcohol dehydrogenase-like predicted oxidoreductase
MDKRPYGNTGIQLSILGFGGIVVTDVPQPEANKYVAEAIDRGINYFDVSPNYGNAQDRLGPALAGKRQRIFLACKTEQRSAQASEAELNQSLRILQTDCFDLYQLHAVKKLSEVETIFGPGGAMETLLKARQAGKIRYLGFSAHTEEAALALLERFAFDSVLYPINWASLLNSGFGKRVLAEAEARGVARLALKALARTDWPEGLAREDRKYPKCWYEPIEDEFLADLALRFALSQPITAAIPPGDIRLFRMALRIAEKYQPLTPDELTRLEREAARLRSLFPKAYA